MLIIITLTIKILLFIRFECKNISASLLTCPESPTFIIDHLLLSDTFMCL